jgi:hypothetical protein
LSVLLDAACAAANGFQKAISGNMNGYRETGGEVYNLPSFPVLSKPVGMATSGFQKPLFDSLAGFLNALNQWE